MTRSLPERTLLRRVRSWQKAILAELAEQHSHRSDAEQHSSAQAVILSVLTFHLCEQQGILQPGWLAALRVDCDLGDRLRERWQRLPIAGLPWQERLEVAPSDRCLRHLVQDCCQELAPGSGLSIASLGQVYESLLQTVDRGSVRKTGGSFYTPEAIVAYVLQNTLMPCLQQAGDRPISLRPLSLRLLDPACGGGIFLLSAYQMLTEWYLNRYLDQYFKSNYFNQSSGSKSHNPELIQRNKDGSWSLTLAERSRILRAHLYGIDIDRDAVAVTILSLELQRLSGIIETAEKLEPELPARSLCDLSENVSCGNTIRVGDRALENAFDLVVGNPPYVDSEWMSIHLSDWRRYCTGRYQTAVGNWDLFCIFVERALAFCQPQGLTSLVVPNKLASADYAAAARSLLTRQATLRSLRDYSKVAAFSASVYPLVYVAQKTGETGRQRPVWCEQMSSLEQVETACWQSLPQPPAPWPIAAPPQQIALFDRLSQFPKLSAIAQITGAATVSEAYAIQPLIRDVESCDAQIADAPETAGWKLVNSGTIDRYRLLWGKKPTRYLGQTYQRPILPIGAIGKLPLPRQQQTRQPKILVAGLTRSLECGLDAAGTVLAGKSTVVIRCPELDLRCLLGILNSRLIQLYFCSQFAGNQLQGGYLRVGSPQMRQIPIPADLPDRCPDRLSAGSLASAYPQLVELVERQLTGDRPDPAIDRVIDRLVYQIYRLSDSEIEAIQSE